MGSVELAVVAIGCLRAVSAIALAVSAGSFAIVLPFVRGLLHSPPPCLRTGPKLELMLLDGAIRTYTTFRGRLPRDLHELIVPDGRGRRFLPSGVVPKDPWGRPYVYWTNGDGTFEIATYGEDGVVGGNGDDRDWILSTVRTRRR